MAYERAEKLEITETIFDDMAKNPEEFERHTRKFYTFFCRPCGYEPRLLDARLLDAYVAFRRDKKHMSNSLPDKNSVPDHFKIAGVLVYWLRRFAPVSDLRDLSSTREASEDLMELLKKYPSEILAFGFGLSICNYFESEKKYNPVGKPSVDANFYNIICYMMKFKNISPHSLGAIYRALYVPLLPLQTQ